MWFCRCAWQWVPGGRTFREAHADVSSDRTCCSARRSSPDCVARLELSPLPTRPRSPLRQGVVPAIHLASHRAGHVLPGRLSLTGVQARRLGAVERLLLDCNERIESHSIREHAPPLVSRKNQGNLNAGQKRKRQPKLPFAGSLCSCLTRSCDGVQRPGRSSPGPAGRGWRARESSRNSARCKPVPGCRW